MENINIVRASYLDFEPLKNIMLIALREAPTAFSVDHSEYAMNTDDWWRNYLSSFLYGFNATMFIAKDGDKSIGIFGILYERNTRRKHIASLVWFYVDKEYRNSGIGKKLMAKVMEEIKLKPEIRKVNLLMNAPQKSALKIYESYGFKIAGTLKDEMKINDEFIDEYVLELFLQ